MLDDVNKGSDVKSGSFDLLIEERFVAFLVAELAGEAISYMKLMSRISPNLSTISCLLFSLMTISCSSKFQCLIISNL